MSSLSQCYGVSLCNIISPCYGVSLCYGVSPCYGVSLCYSASPKGMKDEVKRPKVGGAPRLLVSKIKRCDNLGWPNKGGSNAGFPCAFSGTLGLGRQLPLRPGSSLSRR